jgi:hypothetical protein
MQTFSYVTKTYSYVTQKFSYVTQKFSQVTQTYSYVRQPFGPVLRYLLYVFAVKIRVKHLPAGISIQTLPVNACPL